MKNSAPPRPRLRAALLAAALILPGTGVVLWAANQSGTPQSGPPQGNQAQGNHARGSESAPSAATVPDGVGSTATATTAPPATTAPAKSPPAKSTVPATDPVPVDPAPVDRKGKSEQQLATIPQPVARAVPLTDKKAVAPAITATITGLEAVDGEAQGIGEIAGPAVRFRVTVHNGTTSALKLESALVNVSYGKGRTPAGPLSGPGATGFPAVANPGASVSSVLVFAVPKEQRGTFRIEFSLNALTPIAVFEGQAPS